MSTYTFYAIFVIFAVDLVYMIVKKCAVINMNKAVNARNEAKVMELLSKMYVNKTMSEFTKDMFLANVKTWGKDRIQLKQLLDEMDSKNFDKKDVKTYLDLYFHIFLHEHDFEYAAILLERIKKSQDEKFIWYNERAYEVIVNRRSDLIKEMEASIEAKEYSGFELGVLAYMIGIQHIYLKDYDQALAYFNSSLICFHPKELYVDVAKKYISKLEKDGELIL